MIKPEIQFQPAIVLDNFCLEAGYRSPEYQLLGAEGVVHSPVFAYKVTVDNIDQVSTGQSKKKAKHSAAHCALIELLNRAKEILKDTDPSITLEQFKETEEYTCAAFGEQKNKAYVKAGYIYLMGLEKSILEYETPNTSDQNQINSVGKLQEVCMKNKWTPPKYEEVNERLPNIGAEKIFAMHCEININDEILFEKGEGRSKKEAKRLSALKMLKVLEKRNLFSFVEEPDDLNKKLKKLDESYTNEFIPAMNKIDQLYEQIDKVLHIELDNKILYCLDKKNVNFCDKLEDLAMYIECKVEYIDFLPLEDEELTYSSLVSLTPYYNCPPIVTGYGDSMVSALESRKQAAKTALQFFKTIKSRNFTS